MTANLATEKGWMALLEALVLLVLTLAVALAFRFPGAWLLVPLVWLVVARRDLDDYGLHGRNLQAPGFHVKLFFGVFVPYLCLHFAYGRWWLGEQFRFTLPNEFPSLVAEQILGVGLSEEFFFRAYLQTQLDRCFGYRWKVLGARVGWGFLLSATIFAFCHIFHGGPARLVTFFPGLLYGWLWARTHNVFVPGFYHGLSNILMNVMLASLHSV